MKKKYMDYLFLLLLIFILLLPFDRAEWISLRIDFWINALWNYMWQVCVLVWLVNSLVKPFLKGEWKETSHEDH